jgi:hypothetical protein
MFAFSPEFIPLVVYLVTSGVTNVFGSISGKGTIAVAAAVTAFISFGEQLINGAFPEAAPVVTAFANLAIAFFGSAGVHKALKYHVGGASPK